MTAPADVGAPAGAQRDRPRMPSWLPRRIRSKLIMLHTGFSLAMAVALLLVLRAPVRDIVQEAEAMEALLALELYGIAPEAFRAPLRADVAVESGSAARLGIGEALAERARARPGEVVVARDGQGPLAAVRWDDAAQEFTRAAVRIPEAREAVNRLYMLLILALLAVYGLIALTLEAFVLPRQVYEPIARLRAADDAVQAGRVEREIIPEDEIPTDELGEIMRSRNRSIRTLRRQERELESALGTLETVAGELKRKNHLLETAQRNLADQDRLASLGMLSAGIAHELNTPLSVLKGCVEELASAGPGEMPRERVALMRRVVGRLERLSESLLDFARARPPAMHDVRLREITEEAWTLVSLDRAASGVVFQNTIPADTAVTGDGDRLTQVLVNLLRNAVDAMEGRGRIGVAAEESRRAERDWVSLTVTDSGPGIDPSIMPRLFEPFSSTRLDSHGTGLGLAVAEGIVREHAGVLLARNGAEGGAVFEVMLPRRADAALDPGAAGPGTLTPPGAGGDADRSAS